MRWLLFLWCGLAWAGGDFLIVTSEKTDIQALSEFQVRSIYLGKLDHIEASPVQFINLRKRDAVRRAFETALFGKGFDLEDYWLSQRLLDQATPPLEVGSWTLILAYLQRNPGLIGFLEVKHENDLAKLNLKILARIKGKKDS